MRISRKIVDGIVVLKPHGYLVGDVGERLHEMVKAEVAGGVKQLIIDMSKCRSINSWGLGGLVAAQKTCDEGGCVLRLCDLRGRARLPFEKIPKVAALFAIHEKRDDAVAAFRRTDEGAGS